MLQYLIQFSLYYLSSRHLREVKNKRKFQTFSSKSGRDLLREVPGRLQEVSNIVIWLENLCKLVVEETCRLGVYYNSFSEFSGSQQLWFDY